VSTLSFAMIRGVHVDVTVMGAFQVNEIGDFESWFNPSSGLSCSRRLCRILPRKNSNQLAGPRFTSIPISRKLSCDGVM